MAGKKSVIIEKLEVNTCCLEAKTINNSSGSGVRLMGGVTAGSEKRTTSEVNFEKGGKRYKMKTSQGNIVKGSDVDLLELK